MLEVSVPLGSQGARGSLKDSTMLVQQFQVTAAGQCSLIQSWIPSAACLLSPSSQLLNRATLHMASGLTVPCIWDQSWAQLAALAAARKVHHAGTSNIVAAPAPASRAVVPPISHAAAPPHVTPPATPVQHQVTARRQNLHVSFMRVTCGHTDSILPFCNALAKECGYILPLHTRLIRAQHVEQPLPASCLLILSEPLGAIGHTCGSTDS